MMGFVRTGLRWSGLLGEEGTGDEGWERREYDCLGSIGDVPKRCRNSGKGKV